jgi:hypothetical protein
VQQPDQLLRPHIGLRVVSRCGSRSAEYGCCQQPDYDRSTASHALPEYQKRIVKPILPSPARLDELSVKILIQEATARAAIPFAPHGARRLIIKSISAKQRPRRPIEAPKNRA